MGNPGADDQNLFEDIAPDLKPIQIESLCTSCGDNGTTTILLTSIPDFKDVVLMSFECPHCGNRNNEIQRTSAPQARGVKLSCKIDGKEDLNRQVVVAETCRVSVPDVELETPPRTKSGYVSTVEGILKCTIDDLSLAQPLRRVQDPEVYRKLEDIIAKLSEYREGAEAFTLVLDDPAGNSHISRLGEHDDALERVEYERTERDDAVVDGVVEAASQGAQDTQSTSCDGASLPQEEGIVSQEPPIGSKSVFDSGDDPIPDVIVLPSQCASCKMPNETRMHVTNIPYFKEVVIMSTTCDHCGYRSNEVKAGGPVSEKGRRISCKIQGKEDLSRDVLKSETASLKVPELELELDAGTMSGRFTTVEGLLQSVRDNMPSGLGDEERRAAFQRFLGRLSKAIGALEPYTIVLDDPLANSYIQNLHAPDPDPNMTIEDYDRSWEQNEILGLNDMDVGQGQMA